MIQKLRKEIKSFDIVHMHNYITFQNTVASHYARQYGVPCVLQAHGALARKLGRKWVNKISDTVWGRRILRDASKVIAVTKIEAKQYQDLGLSEDKIEVVPNGIDLSEFDNLPERGEFRRKYGFNDNEKIILYLGRVHKIKGLDLLARAFADLSKPLNDIRLVIVGPDDGYLSSLKKLVAALGISDKVLFTGPLHGQEKLKAYVDAEVYVLPSVYEIFGITVLEALGCGTPVIVTDRCGIADVIDGQAGLVVPYDEEQLRNAVLKLLDDDKMRQRFSQKGKLLVREKFNWEQIVEQIEGLYERVIK
jgi:glycosyltransferase involved in cell wall biosynthesis